MITEQSIREKTTDAIRRLLSQAQNLKASGSGELGNSDVSTASSYYFVWKRKNIWIPIYFLILFPISIFWNAKIGVFFILLALIIKEFQDSATTKKRYIQNMAGSWSGIENPEEYQKFLVLELWKNLVKTDKKYSFEFNDFKYFIHIFILVLLISVFFFLPANYIKIILILKIVIFTYSEIVLLVNFVDEPRA